MASSDGLIWKMQGGIGQARELRRQGDSSGARSILEQVAMDAHRGGVRSSQLSWLLAVVCDETGDLPAAFDHIHRAIDEDPLSPEARESLQILLTRVRASLSDRTRAQDDPSTPVLYRILVREDRTTVAPHLAMARWLAATDQMDEAVNLARATTQLYPGSVKAWRQLVKLAVATGDKAMAREAKARAAKAQSAENREQSAPRATQSKAKA
jgi:hypothetical protein